MTFVKISQLCCHINIPYLVMESTFHSKVLSYLKKGTLLQNAAIIRKQSMKNIADKSIMHLRNDGSSIIFHEKKKSSSDSNKTSHVFPKDSKKVWTMHQS